VDEEKWNRFLLSDSSFLMNKMGPESFELRGEMLPLRDILLRFGPGVFVQPVFVQLFDPA
jgi:hypothetical protein